jgi:hypothetical protein
VYKIGDEEGKNHAEVRNKWFSTVMSQAKLKGNAEIIKPPRFGSGTYMTVAIIQRQDWLGADDSIIDKEKVVAKLKEYEQFLDDCLK